MKKEDENDDDHHHCRIRNDVMIVSIRSVTFNTFLFSLFNASSTLLSILLCLVLLFCFLRSYSIFLLLSIVLAVLFSFSFYLILNFLFFFLLISLCSTRLFWTVCTCFSCCIYLILWPSSSVSQSSEPKSPTKYKCWRRKKPA